MSGRGRHSLPDHMVCGQATQHYVWFIVFCRVAVVSTRRGMLVAAMVLVVVCDTDLHSVWGACIVIATNHGTPRKEPRDEHHGD